jgi:isopentenyl diphosphate isomerase/L-lactate dehydrogenase-like FMN-dependent dehydrogenase
MPGTADVLSEIVSALKKRKLKMKIYVDGGIRSGEDVFKMFALGAEAVLVGRPFCINVVGGGKNGLKFMHQEYLNGLLRTMRLTGISTLSKIQKKHIQMV